MKQNSQGSVTITIKQSLTSIKNEQDEKTLSNKINKIEEQIRIDKN